MSDDFDDVYMSTLATLDDPIIDEYDRDEMEELDNVADENSDAEIFQDQIDWDHQNFTNTSAWETYQPFDENVRVHHRHSSDIQKECRKGEEVCLWRLQVVVMQRPTYWTVCKYGGDHICHNNDILQSNIHLNAHFIAREMWNAMSENTRLPPLIQALQDSSPNNFVNWDVTPLDDGTMQVNHIFWSFSECILAFNHCHTLICIDDTHMYGKYNAKLLVAIRHAGILATMREPEWQEPEAYHRVCIRHLQSNFITKVKDEVLKAKLGDVAYVKELKFKKNFAELLQLLQDKPLSRKCLKDMDVELWTQAFDHGGFRWGSMTTIASECFNKIMKSGHDLTIFSLVMYMFKQPSAYFVKRSMSPYSNDGALFPPKI
ncbi:hypothetical protein QQ045_012591 [Rhodiola kirilowii]